MGPISSQRDSSTFCWLPPDRLPTVTRGLAARTRSALNAPRPALRGCGEVEDAVAARVAVDHADIDVLAARHVEEQAEPLAVLGQVGEAAVERVLGPA